MVVPEFCDAPHGYWGRNPFKYNSDYVGILTLLLAVLALARRRDATRLFLGGIAVFAILYALERNHSQALEAEALDRYGLLELVTDPDVLARCTPSLPLLEAILRLKDRMSPEVLRAAESTGADGVARGGGASEQPPMPDESEAAFSDDDIPF